MRGKRVTSLFSLRVIVFVIGTALLPAASSFAQGDLLISPIRIVFDGTKKSQEINLANVGKDTASYTISVLDYRMKDDGAFEEIKVPDSGQNFAGPFLRFFPRKVTLAPNEAQVVKLQLVKTNDLQPGEYRSHLYFRAVPDEKPLGEKPKKDTAAISIQLTPIFGITIPVIIRVGENTAEPTINNLIFFMTDNKPNLHVTFNRTGNMSVYGDVKIDHISPGGKITQVKVVKGVSVYTPNLLRNFNFELDTDTGVDFHKGKLHVTYTLQTTDKSVKATEAELILN